MPDFAQLHKDVVFGNSGGKIIWQPRIQCWYSDKKFAKQPLPEPYEGMELNDIYRELDCSARLYSFNSCFKRIENPKVIHTEEQLNDTDAKVTIETPAGTQIAVNRRSPNNPAAIRIKWEVETEEELKAAAWREEHAEWEWDQARYDKLIEETGDLGAPTMFMPRMNVQDLYINKMGVEKAIFALYDWPDTVGAYFKALEESHDRLIEIINSSPVDIINFGENIHSGTLTPDLFVKYHLPACQRRCDKLHAAGKFTTSHWDGNCGPLLKLAQETGLDGIEAITPKPQGDVTLEETKEALGDDMFLLDGIPAVYFDTTFPEETLEECARRVIDLFAPNLVLGISDEISSTGDIERVRLVNKITDEYNSKFE
ncbi:uroporphyrinogen decarboxylase family protein [Planctomycetota bacterium]